MIRLLTRLTVVLACGITITSSLQAQELPDQVKIDGITRVKQLPNYCGPAALTSVLQLEGIQTTQQTIAKSIYDPAIGATNGADMLLYARQKGFRSYSWNAALEDIKDKIATGIPVLVLQQNSLLDTSGHFRVVTGYDESAEKLYVIDPYYDDITELSYRKFLALWKQMGNWAMVLLPDGKESSKTEMLKKSPVVHMDLSYALYKRKDYDCAAAEAQTALEIEPDNEFMLTLLEKIQKARANGVAQVKDHVTTPC